MDNQQMMEHALELKMRYLIAVKGDITSCLIYLEEVEEKKGENLIDKYRYMDWLVSAVLAYTNKRLADIGMRTTEQDFLGIYEYYTSKKILWMAGNSV